MTNVNITKTRRETGYKARPGTNIRTTAAEDEAFLAVLYPRFRDRPYFDAWCVSSAASFEMLKALEPIRPKLTKLAGTRHLALDDDSQRAVTRWLFRLSGAGKLESSRDGWFRVPTPQLAPEALT